MPFEVVLLATTLWAANASRASVGSAEYASLEVRVLESAPPRFQLTIRRDTPSTGWTLRVDGVTVDREARRIEVRLTELPPEGIAATVITAVEARADLGPLEAGRWFLELRSREREAGPYQPALAAILTAWP